MKASSFFATVRVLALVLSGAVAGQAAPILSQQLDPPEANVGDVISLSFTVQNVNSGLNISLPSIDGLQVDPSIMRGSKFSFNNGVISSSASETFRLSATKPGDFTIPAFDIRLPDGSVLHAHEMKLHILGNPGAPVTDPQASNSPTQPASPSASAPAMPVFNPNGPVVYPPGTNPPANNAAPAPTTATLDNGNGGTVTIPTEPDGRPAKVFILITPQTTDTYVGESIPMHIEFYIRQDVDAQQDSLPTIKGSDFLMNNLSVRFRVDGIMIMNEPFRRESWFTAISAPKSGDFPLQMERDTYWRKPMANNPNMLSFFATRPDLAHESIPSNKLTVHVHDLPADGRPDGFSGAIGQFTVTGAALPVAVAVGEPVTLHFSVTGEGNFDYVRCPVLPADPAWKTYVPSSKTAYSDTDESHTHAVKNFEMAIIPQKPGTLQLPQASFSYFDPTAKKYTTIPIDLPAITVTGSAASTTPTGSATDVASTPVDPSSASWFAPNRVSSGSTRMNLAPVFWRPWFWVVQGGLFVVLILCALVVYLRSRPKPDNGEAEKLARQNSLHQELDAMAAAREQKDSVAFFLAARHAVQLHLGAQWRVKPETLTLAEIRRRDDALAESLEPLFQQSDEIIYSGGTVAGMDLAHWERHVLELLQPQPQPAKS